MPLTVSAFAAQIKSKYPQYAGVDDDTLTRRMLEKYPQYADKVELEADAPGVAEPGSLQRVVSGVKENLRGVLGPTVAGEAARQAVGGGMAGDIAQGVAGAPERLGRLALGVGGGIVGDVTSGVAGDVNKLTGGLAGRGLAAIGRGVSKLPGTKAVSGVLSGPVANVMQRYGQFRQSLPEAGRLNLEAAEKGINLIGLGAGGAGAKAAGGTIARNIPKKNIISKIPVAIDAQNAAAARAGISLTRAQAATGIGAAKPGGFWGAVEKWTRSLPGASGVYAKFGKQQADEAVNSLTKIFGDDLSAIDEPYAQKIAAAIESKTKESSDMFKAAYSEALAQGKVAYIDGEKAATKITKKLANNPAYINLADTDKGMVDGYIQRLRDIKNKVVTERIPAGPAKVEEGYMKGMDVSVLTGEKPKAGKVGSNYESYRYLQTDVGAAKRQLQKQIWQGTRNDSEVQRAIVALNEISTTMKAAEYNHLRMVGGNDLVDYLKVFDKLYGEEKGEINTLKKMFGIGKDATEKGAVQAETAVKKMLSPQQSDKLTIALKHMDDETKLTAGKALMADIIKRSTASRVVDGKRTIQTIHLAALQKNVDTARNTLTAILGPEKVNQFDDFLVGATKARLQNVGVLDEWNTSGTGLKDALIGMFGLVVHSTKNIAGVAGGAIGARAIAKVATRTPFGPIEKATGRMAVGAGLGALGGASVAPEGKRGEGAAIGAGLGALGAGVAPGVLRLARGLGQR